MAVCEFNDVGEQTGSFCHFNSNLLLGLNLAIQMFFFSVWAEDSLEMTKRTCLQKTAQWLLHIEVDHFVKGKI